MFHSETWDVTCAQTMHEPCGDVGESDQRSADEMLEVARIGCGSAASGCHLAV